MIPLPVVINAMSEAMVAAVRNLERENMKNPQVPITTHHLVHAGMYARTIVIPPGMVMTGALINRATTLIVAGDVSVTIGNHVQRLTGYHVIPASAYRKQAYMAHAETHLTMLFPTNSQDIGTIENSFTDEADMLISRHAENVVTITGE